MCTGSTSCGQLRRKLEFFGHRDAACVWRKKDEAYNPTNIVPTVKKVVGVLCCWDASVCLKLKTSSKWKAL